eukprot:snap_masked-scaffold_73-processed-gene-0.8-mRNA-1 protein AED:1.00 eAED:1.00 QI:0/0/0/0/1/1/2/0/110
MIKVIKNQRYTIVAFGDVVGAKFPNYHLWKSKYTVVHKKNVIFLKPCEAANAEPSFPTVAKVATKFLAIQKSSVGSERSFSHGRFEYRGKENMSDKTFMTRTNAREWMWL